MKKAITLLAAALLMSPAIAFSDVSTNDVTGNWKGTLDAGPVKLRLEFKISKAAGGDLTAKLDSPDQGARDIPVDTVTVNNGTLRLEVKTVNGVYEGTMDAAGKKATGEWKQGPQALPLILERGQGAASTPGAEKLSPSDLAASKQAAQKVAGIWNGTLAAGAANLRLRLNITKTASGAAMGTMDSLDQGAKDIPMSSITLKADKVRFEVRGIGGVYEGTLSADGSALGGQWHQGGQTMPLDFTKAAPK
jgi:hypothetical protein